MRNCALVCGVVYLSACATPPPHAVVTVEDPEGLAAAAVTLAVGSDPDDLTNIALEGEVFTTEVGISVTLTRAVAGSEGLWFDALDADGNVVGRAWAQIEFASKRRGGETVTLAQPCDADADCGDGVFCNGDEICVDRICDLGEEPCPSSPFACVEVGCIEGAQVCDISVDHEQCGAVVLPDGSAEETYCDTAAGCVRGQGCQEETGAADCDDGIDCNGAEQCIANRCVGGAPPDVDDDNPCTIDFCAEGFGTGGGADHIQAPDGNNCELAPASTCADSTCPVPCFANQCLGVCFSGICAASGCGDGYRDPSGTGNEECDDGNTNDNDECTNSCTVAVCGDGRTFDTVNGGFEVCDNGSQCTDGTDCTDDTTRCVGIGDGSCLPRDGDGCRSDCLKIEVCGDGILDAGEDCDDGNTGNPNDGCAACQVVVWDAQVRFGFGEGGADPLNKSLGEPSMITSDRAGNVYVYEPRWGQIRRIVTDSTGSYYIPVAGNGNLLLRGEEGPATTATLTVTLGMDIDGLGNLVLADTGANRLMRVDARTGYIERIAGTGVPGLAAPFDPVVGDGGPALNAEFYLPGGLVVDGQGNIYVADEGNDRIRRIDGATSIATTVAGVGEVGYLAGAGVALDAGIDDVNDVELDSKGRVIILDTENYLIRRVDLAAGTIETVAGVPNLGSPSGFGDGGPALSARLGTAYGMAVDSQDRIFFTDISNDTIRMVDTHGSDDPAVYTMHRVACTSTRAYSDGCGGCSGGLCANCPGGLGVALDADCANPWSIDADAADNVYFTDEDNNRVRKLSDADGDGAYSIETIAGNGATIVGDLTNPSVTVPYVLREAPGSVGVILPSTITDLSTINVQSIDIFLADFTTDRVMMINQATNEYIELAGNGEYGYSGDGGQALAASFAYPRSVAPVDVDPTAGVEYVVYVADRDNHRIRRIASDGTVDTVAGTGVPGYNNEGRADQRQLNFPTGVLVDSNGDLLIADSENHRIRRVDFGGDPFDASTNVMSTAIGDGTPGYNADGNGFCMAPASCRVNQPRAMFGIPLSALEPTATGDLIFIADRGNHRVRLYVNGDVPVPILGMVHVEIVVTMAGNGSRGFDPNPAGGYPTDATQTPLEFPRGLFPHVDSGCGTCILVTDGVDRVRYIQINFTPSLPPDFDFVLDNVLGGEEPEPDGTLATALLRTPEALFALDDDRWLVADRATGHLRLVDLVGDDVSTVVGFPEGLRDDASAVAARDRETFMAPRAVAYDAAHVPPALYVASSRAHTISRVLLTDDGDPLTWSTEHVTGTRRRAGHQDGPADAALFFAPSGLAFDAGNRLLYIAEEGNHTVRALDVDDLAGANAVTTVAGVPGRLGFFGDNIAADEAILNRPSGLAFANGLLYVADTANNRVRVIEDPSGPAPTIFTILGDGEAASGGFGEPARAFPVNHPVGLAVDSYGNLFVASRNSIRLVTSGDDDVARDDDHVETVYGTAPRDTFPESVTTCLSGLGFTSNEERLYFLDACLGFFMQLDRRVVVP